MDRITLVTGGTRGIGKAISIKLKEVGFNVAANFGGNVEAAEKFNQETGIPIYQWSIGSAEQCKLGVKKIERDLGEISVLINNAGITRDTMFHKMTSTMWHEVIDTNVHGLFNMTHPVWEKMRAKR